MSQSVILRKNYSLKKREYELGATLECYAPGSGVLSFVFVKRGGEREGEAIGEKVTARDIELYMKHRDQGMRVDYIITEVSCYAGLVAVKKVFRVDHQTLEMAGKLYRYSGIDHSLQVKVFEEGEWHETMHLSTKAPLNFFLKYEDELTPKIKAVV